MNPAQWTMTGVLALCVVLSAFFSSSETAYSAVNPVRLKMLQQDGNRRAARALRLSENYDRLLTAILVGNNVVNILGTAIATVLFTGLVGELGATLSTVVMTLLILLFGEISPKTLAKQSPETFAVAFATPLTVLVTVLGPLDSLFALWRLLLARLFRPKQTETAIEDELITMVDEAQSEGDMDAHEGELIRSAIDFNDRVVTDIMTPRVDVTALEDTATVPEAAELLRQTAYSRLPVYHEDMDHVIGILNEKDFYVALNRGCQEITGMMQKPVYAPATLKVSKLLKLFQSTKTHMVVVLDEFGGTEGVVTLEDVLEELVGEIYDEHDDVSEELVRQPDGSLLVDGGMLLSELLEQLNIEDHYEADTVGGWAGEVLGRIPTVGSVFRVEDVEVTVDAMDKRRVLRVCVKRTAETSGTNEGGEHDG